MNTVNQNNKSIYNQCIDLGLKIDHYRSDLYIKHCPKSMELVSSFNKKINIFIDNIDGELWIDVPFEYAPYWEEKLQKTI